MSRGETGARASAFACAVIVAAVSLLAASSSLANSHSDPRQSAFDADLSASKPKLSRCHSQAPIYRLRSNVPCRTARSVSRRSGLGNSAPGWKCDAEKARSEGVYLVSCKRRRGNGLVRYDYVAGGRAGPYTGGS